MYFDRSILIRVILIECMKPLTIVLFLFLSACATTYTKTWQVHPDDMERFNADTIKCQQEARATNSLAGGGVYDNVLDYCLQKIGYRLDITRN